VSSVESNVPGEISHNIGGPWTPDVWTQGPDGLVASCQADLWAVDKDLGSALGPGSGVPSMAGPADQKANESDQVIDPTTPGDEPGGPGYGSGRATQWQANVQQLRKTEALGGTAKPGDYSPPAQDANPPA
jgi:hypothetical protein